MPSKTNKELDQLRKKFTLLSNGKSEVDETSENTNNPDTKPSGLVKSWLPLVFAGLSLTVSIASFSLSNIYVHHKMIIASTLSNNVKYESPLLFSKDGSENEVLSFIFMNQGTVTENVVRPSLVTGDGRVNTFHSSQGAFVLKPGESKLVELTIPEQEVKSVLKYENDYQSISVQILYVAQDGKVRSTRRVITHVSSEPNYSDGYKIDTQYPDPIVLYDNWGFQVD